MKQACEQWELKNEKSIHGLVIISPNSDDAGSLNYQTGFNDVKGKKKPEIVIIM